MLCTLCTATLMSVLELAHITDTSGFTSVAVITIDVVPPGHARELP